LNADDDASTAQLFYVVYNATTLAEISIPNRNKISDLAVSVPIIVGVRIKDYSSGTPIPYTIRVNTASVATALPRNTYYANSIAYGAPVTHKFTVTAAGTYTITWEDYDNSGTYDANVQVTVIAADGTTILAGPDDTNNLSIGLLTADTYFIEVKRTGLETNYSANGYYRIRWN